MLKEITEKEALEMYIEGKDVKILAPKFDFDDLDSEWIDYSADMLSSLLDGIIYMTDEEEKTEVVFDEPVEVADTKPEPEPETPASKYAPKNLDNGKIAALHRAGWSNEKIADEMGTTGVTIGNRIKKMKEKGDL